jgi:hypothetical protein
VGRHGDYWPRIGRAWMETPRSLTARIPSGKARGAFVLGL